MNPSGPAQRVFAQVDTKHTWAEFKSIEAIPELNLDGGISAQVWKEPSGSMLVRTVAPGEDFWAYTKSCYSKAGYLDSIEFELHTAWGWYYKAEGPFIMNRFHRATEQFFNSKTDQPLVVSPQEPDDSPGMLIPVLYKRTKMLPFADLLEK
jgi:hypothetical protein